MKKHVDGCWASPAVPAPPMGSLFPWHVPCLGSGFSEPLSAHHQLIPNSLLLGFPLESICNQADLSTNASGALHCLGIKFKFLSLACRVIQSLPQTDFPASPIQLLSRLPRLCTPHWQAQAHPSPRLIPVHGLSPSCSPSSPLVLPTAQHPDTTLDGKFLLTLCSHLKQSLPLCSFPWLQDTFPRRNSFPLFLCTYRTLPYIYHGRCGLCRLCVWLLP